MDSTLAKGLAVLEWLAQQPRPARVSDVAKAFGVVRSNAHRTLQTLVACGWAQQDPQTTAYRASLKLFELGAMVEAASDLRELLRPHLAELAKTTGETIHLAVLDGADIVYIDKFDSPLPVAAYSRIGGRASAACVASGKALLAALNEDESTLRARLGDLSAHTEHSMTDYADLLKDLAQTRDRGTAENRQEWRIGVCGLGAPVFNARQEPVAALGISVPAIRFERRRALALSRTLLAQAQEASRTLGFRGTRPSI